VVYELKIIFEKFKISKKISKFNYTYLKLNLNNSDNLKFLIMYNILICQQYVFIENN